MPITSVLIIDVGGSAIDLFWTRAGKAEPFLVGEISRASAGNERTSIRAQYAQIPLVSAPVLASQAAAVEAKFALGVPVPCAGYVFNNAMATVNCSGKVSAEMIPGLVDGSGIPMWTINLTLSQAN